MQNFNSSQLGHFLDFTFWQQAKKLLDFQIQQMEKNKHYNTLSMFYYKQIVPLTIALETEDYFNQRVASNLFYGLNREFAFHDYVIPKTCLGLRNQKFFTYPMRVLYYSIGLYLLKLSQKSLQDYVKNHKHLKCYYGGNLHFEDKSLVINHETTFYQNYYKQFKKQVRMQANNDIDNKLVIKLDIQNYFDHVSVPILLQQLDRFVKPSVKETLSFDASTKEQINFYFNYISENKGGIPQADNDIISGFLGHLYLLCSDLVIDTEICKYRDFLKEYHIIRYVDDTFIVINFLETTEKQQKETITDSLTSQISDVLHYHSGLRLNTKTRLYWLSDLEHKKELLKDLKKVSPEYHFNDDDSDETPQNKITNIFDELQKLKSSSIDISLGHDGSLQEEILKEVYNKNVNQLLETENNNNLIEEIFTDFDFNFVKAMPREIIVIIAKNEVVLNNFTQFLYEKKDLTTRDIYLIIKYLCQTNFTNDELLGKLESNPSFRQVISVYREAQIASERPGYYDLPDTKVLLLLEDAQIVEQIRLRVFNERIGFYSVALNHLLNEVHAICLLFDPIDPTKKNKYEVDDAVKYLASKWVPHGTCIDICNLFDRRNRNTVSHPGSRENIAWGVTKDEYFKYFDAVNKCLEIIL
ncbi:AbiA family abortive infection protein [Nostoc sp.]|uniref:AbiA family abortive infection protein n=1 Tax=Nostoc sp. TaxID=1180 RepID=UPI0035944B87